MFVYPKNPAVLNLPIWFPDERPIYTPETISGIRPDEGSTTALRTIRLRTDGIFNGLDDVFETASRELARVAETCGALIVDHTWGLYRMSAKDLGNDDIRACEHVYREFGIPKDHILAAEVHVITDGNTVTPTDDLFFGIVNNVTYYKRTADGHFLSDMAASQFIEVLGQEENLHMVDIDLWFGYKHLD